MSHKALKLSPKEWMKEKRKSLGYPDYVNIDICWIDNFVSKLPKEVRDESKKIWLSRINKSVEEFLEEQMEEYKENFILTLNEQEKKIVKNCYFGILPTNQFNALIEKTPWGEQIIILHSELTHIIGIWCHWYTRCSEEKCNILDTNLKKMQMLEYMVYAWNKNSLISKELPDIYPKSLKNWEYSETLAKACINFIMGHELGHLFHKHNSYSCNKEINYSMEYLADEKGMEICLKMYLLYTKANKYDIADAYLLAPFMSLAILSLFGDISNNTHPSPTMRKKNLMLKITKFFTKLNLKEILSSDYFKSLFNEIEQIFSIFANYSKDIQDIIHQKIL